MPRLFLVCPLAAAAMTWSAGSAAAWTFTETDICRLTHAEDTASVEVTFDPAAGLYSITLTRTAGAWPSAPLFSLRFDGPRALAIGTDRQVLVDDGRSLTVTDTGFGNVLDGIEYNSRMTALIGDMAVGLSTETAAAAVQAFRDCPSAPTS